MMINITEIDTHVLTLLILKKLKLLEINIYRELVMRANNK